MRLSEREPLGWLTLAPAGSRGSCRARPRHRGGYVPWGEDIEAGLASGGELDALDAAPGARPHRVRVGTATKVKYGCDDNRLDVVPLAGPSFREGVVWVLPPGGAAAWTPAAMAITVKSSTPKQRAFAIGGVVLTLTATDPMHGVLQISRDGTTVLTVDFEHGAMEGDESELDLAGGVGVPEPVAAWRLGEGADAPLLVATATPSHEGVHLAAYLVEARTSREVDAMTRYLYLCAF
ncbi:MAG: hypothetical protein KIT31_28160 [Deltaproteobacteria bacterium]|nr:hypothetical protein [Deltaproteobacteria bacterium]